MTCGPNGCRGNCDQGRKCDDSHMATRRAYWMEPQEPEPACEWWECPVNLALLIVVAVFVWGAVATALA